MVSEHTEGLQQRLLKMSQQQALTVAKALYRSSQNPLERTDPDYLAYLQVATDLDVPEILLREGRNILVALAYHLVIKEVL